MALSMRRPEASAPLSAERWDDGVQGAAAALLLHMPRFCPAHARAARARAALLARGVLSGAALLAPGHGACLWEAGSLAGCFPVGDAAATEPFLRPFLQPEAPVPALHLRGSPHAFVVFRRDARSLYAIAARRAGGIAAHALPCGTLVTAFDRPHNPRTVLPELEAACDALR